MKAPDLKAYQVLWGQEGCRGQSTGMEMSAAVCFGYCLRPTLCVCLWGSQNSRILVPVFHILSIFWAVLSLASALESIVHNSVSKGEGELKVQFVKEKAKQ